MTVRPATLDDSTGINAVYNPFIRASAATFETEPVSETARKEWLTRLDGDPRTPVFVVERDGEIVGFANAAPFDPRQAYETSVKTSIFLADAVAGQGLGRRLYAALFKALADADVHRAYALIVAPNPASAALHEAFGFRHIMTLDEVGRKFGVYHSVMWFEKRF